MNTWFLWISLISVFAQGLFEPDIEWSHGDVNFYGVPIDQDFAFRRIQRLSDAKKYISPIHPLVVLVHGFQGAHNSTSMTLLSEALHTKKERSILAIQYKSSQYEVTVQEVPRIGDQVFQVLGLLKTAGLADIESTTFIGFSLGAHVSGEVGRRLAKDGKTLKTIVALDPARPIFEDLTDYERLSRSDAQTVTVIHTSWSLGFYEPLGHYDFFPNGGEEPQPMCLKYIHNLMCSHGMAVKLMAEAIVQPNSFPAVFCPSWDAYLGDHCSDGPVIWMNLDLNTTAPEGSYYFQTSDVSPYGLNYRATAQPPFPTLDEESEDGGDFSSNLIGKGLGDPHSSKYFFPRATGSKSSLACALMVIAALSHSLI